MHEFRSLQQPYGDKWDEFSQWDTNNDGVISRDEFHDARQRALGEQGGERQCDCLSYFVFLLPSFVVSSHLLVACCSVFLLSCSAQLLSTKQSSQCCADYSVGRSVSQSGDLSLSRSQMQHDSSITTHSVTGAIAAPTDSPAIRPSYSPSSPPAPVATWLYSENSWIRMSAGLDCRITSK